MSSALETSALCLQSVSFSYHKKPFINDLSLAIPKESTTSIIGPNGCGKSTLFKLFGGILKAHTGTVLLDDISLSELSTNERAQKLALLSQGSKVPAMSVEDLVACGRYPYRGGKQASSSSKTDAEHVEQAMRLTGVLRHSKADMRFLSGGERQRAFIAMTLAQDTDIIILDEPTTYLDVSACHEIMELIVTLSQLHNKTIVTIIHDIDLALRYSSRVVVMQEGRIECSAPVTEARVVNTIESTFNIQVHACHIEGKVSHALFPH